MRVERRLGRELLAGLAGHELAYHGGETRADEGQEPCEEGPERATEPVEDCGGEKPLKKASLDVWDWERDDVGRRAVQHGGVLGATLY